MPRWSCPVRLKNFHKAPAASGVYEIGFCRGRFVPRYIGMSESNAGIRGRLQNHATGSHNEDIFFYRIFAQRDNLYCRWQVVENAREREARLLNRKSYAWNRRIEKL